ncbi:CRAL/TRIO domain protein [Sphaerosporella brunnea]|uniref:CRAL/TRIO domain protein n=1 Tax=Sphaerosporella brunnea TaxID=1250544 RepID=A0A5J5F434_9PEZI|nr:CRAL/TRIO domain protein [Sphaerosporella brunnea]
MNEKADPVSESNAAAPAAPEASAEKVPAPAVIEPETKAPATEDTLVKVKTAIREEEAKTGKKLVPFLDPTPSCKPAPAPALTADQESKYEAVLAYCNEIKTLPVSTEKGAESRELDDVERMWLTRECLLRFLRATKWDVEGAKKRLEQTIVWRREYGLRDHSPEYIGPENETGKQVILGYDNECRPCLYLAPSAQNTERSPRQIQHLVFMLERVIDLMPAGQETLALLVNFGASTKSSNPSISQGREVLNILQNHYPERLGRALCINLPWFVWGFFKLINPFIDPLTREKLKFNENLRDHVPPEQLDKRFGGDCEFDYDHSKYWPELCRLTDEKRAQMTARWIAGGSKIGASEFELKGGDSLSAGMQDLEVKN